MASCVAGAVGADSFNVYLAVASTNNTIGGRDLALKNGQNENCAYLMKFDKEDNPNQNSRVQTAETNGQITSDNEEQDDENTNNKDSPDTEKDEEDSECDHLDLCKSQLWL